MIGKCPSCGILLKEPPFGNRNTNEVVLTLKYRDLIENNKKNSAEKKGYCVLCNASKNEIKQQRKMLIAN